MGCRAGVEDHAFSVCRKEWELTAVCHETRETARGAVSPRALHVPGLHVSAPEGKRQIRPVLHQLLAGSEP